MRRMEETIFVYNLLHYVNYYLVFSYFRIYTPNFFTNNNFSYNFCQLRCGSFLHSHQRLCFGILLNCPKMKVEFVNQQFRMKIQNASTWWKFSRTLLLIFKNSLLQLLNILNKDRLHTLNVCSFMSKNNKILWFTDKKYSLKNWKYLKKMKHISNVNHLIICFRG